MAKETEHDNESELRLSGQFAYEGLERVIHERSRLGILSSLAAHPKGLLFNDLKELCSLTDGNLSRQIQLLQEAGFVEVWKGYNNNRPQTLCRLTPSGQDRFLEYIAVLEEVVSNAARAAKTDAANNMLPEGLSPT
ncbi:MAG: transcriptional regulator [Tepidisphaeraceae bacterium]